MVALGKVQKGTTARLHQCTLIDADALIMPCSRACDGTDGLTFPTVCYSGFMFVCSSVACDQLMTILKLPNIAPRRAPTTTIALRTTHLIFPNFPLLDIHPHAQSRVYMPSEAADGACTIALRNATANEPSISCMHEPEESTHATDRLLRCTNVLVHPTAFTIEIESESAGSLRVVIMVIVQLLFLTQVQYLGTLLSCYPD